MREAGASLIEVLVASSLTLVLLIMGYQILGSSTQTANAVASRSVSSANAREAIDALEGNLRFATGVWVCAGTPATTTCATPTAPATVASWTRTSTATLFVTNAGGANQPTCDEWTISSSGLQESHVSGTTVTTFFTIPGIMNWAPPAGTAVSPNSTAQSTGFSSTLTGLVVIDLLVNSGAKAAATASAFDTADAVSVHDLIAPDNLPATALAAPLGSC
jgi:Tfp pilus assembly protein PilW